MQNSQSFALSFTRTASESELRRSPAERDCGRVVAQDLARSESIHAPEAAPSQASALLQSKNAARMARECRERQRMHFTDLRPSSTSKAHSNSTFLQLPALADALTSAVHAPLAAPPKSPVPRLRLLPAVRRRRKGDGEVKLAEERVARVASKRTPLRGGQLPRQIVVGERNRHREALV